MENVVEAVKPTEKKGISGSTLKLIAIITMFIDHVGAIIVERMLVQRAGGSAMMMTVDFVMDNATLYWIYMAIRLVGRLGFPIFCFLLIEGFQYTRNVKKYAIRLLLFALVSEIPFDLGFCGGVFNWGYQNVFFTLFIGLLVIMGMHYVEQKQEWNQVLRVIVRIAIAIVGMVAAELLQTDYSAIGVLTIAVMYQYRQKKMLQTALGCTVLTVLNPMEITSFVILLPIRWYNGKRGWNIKWLFYAFYPVHIFLLYIVAYFMGLGGVILR